jgi:ATP-dependent DNA helicase RecG
VIEEILRDAELSVDNKLTFAALILFGTKECLAKYLQTSEIILEYRSDETSIAAHKRFEYRSGYLVINDQLWNEINHRNDNQQYRDGQYIWDIPVFNEQVIREAIQNAVVHRDYQMPGSILIRESPKTLAIVSPGGFLPGISADNICWCHSPRNRKVAEALQRCGLIERSGQGADKMFALSITEAKLPPNFIDTTEHQVAVTINGPVQDSAFIKFFELLKEENKALNLDDLLTLDLVHRDEKLPDKLKSRLPNVLSEGIVEKTGTRGRSVKYILSRRFYRFIGQSGQYTRKKGLDQETNKQLLLKHLHLHGASSIADLEQVTPSLNRNQVHYLLKLLKAEGKVKLGGHTRDSKWELS